MFGREHRSNGSIKPAAGVSQAAAGATSCPPGPRAGHLPKPAPIVSFVWGTPTSAVILRPCRLRRPSRPVSPARSVQLLSSRADRARLIVIAPQRVSAGSGRTAPAPVGPSGAHAQSRDIYSPRRLRQLRPPGKQIPPGRWAANRKGLAPAAAHRRQLRWKGGARRRSAVVHSHDRGTGREQLVWLAWSVPCQSGLLVWYSTRATINHFSYNLISASGAPMRVYKGAPHSGDISTRSPMNKSTVPHVAAQR